MPLQSGHSSPFDLRLLPTTFPSSFFGRDSLNEVFVLRPKLQTPSKRSSIKILPSSAPCRNLRRTNFHWISGLLRLNGLVFKARAPSKGRRRLGGRWDRDRQRQRQDEFAGILDFTFILTFYGGKKSLTFANSNSCRGFTGQEKISHIEIQFNSKTSICIDRLDMYILWT